MPDTQLIPNEEDREFTSTIGHWTGDGIWEAGPIGGKSGLQLVPVLADLSISTILLQYPYIKPQPGQDNDLIFFLTTVGPQSPQLNVAFELTDGVYTFGDSFQFGYSEGVWVQHGDVFTLPADWNKEQSMLTLTLQQTEDYDIDMVYDDFSLIAFVPGKIDHLLLMGIQ